MEGSRKVEKFQLGKYNPEDYIFGEKEKTTIWAEATPFASRE